MSPHQWLGITTATWFIFSDTPRSPISSSPRAQPVRCTIEVHLICDNYGTHKHPIVTAWLEKHPRIHMHFTPTYSSWINQVERFFAYVTADLLQRSDHRSVQALEADIRAWIKAWNRNPKPFIWTKSAEEILGSLSRLLQRTTGAGH
ncbi:MAG TPA: transposase [Dermatophilaceae bacterium]|nr:transposase [Dermatophilaceae bacterium]